MANLDTLHPTFRARIEAALADYPGAYVLSGGRSTARQRELYEGWLARRPGYYPANPPGTSWHEYDPGVPHPGATADQSQATGLVGGVWTLAVDLAGDYWSIRRNAASYDLCFPIKDEDWHAQPAEIREPRRTAGAWKRLPLTPPPPPIDPDPLQFRGRTALHFIGE